MASFLGRVMRHPFSADNEAMIRLAEHPKTRDFARSLDYADLPRGWADNPEIIKLANDAYRQVGIDSPFFRAWYRGSRLVDAQGNPVVMYHGSRRRGLRSIDPDASRLAPPGMGSAYAVGNPVTALSYLMHEKLQDPGYFKFRASLDKALRSGEPVVIPYQRDIPDALRVIRLSDAERADKDFVSELSNKIVHNLNDLDWRINSARLNKSYEQSMPGYAVPKGALESAASEHLAHDLFLDINRARMTDKSIWPDDAFVDPYMGEIYPLYVNTKRPFIVEGIPGRARDWTETGKMRVDMASLTPDELKIAERNRLTGGSRFGYLTPNDVFPDVDYISLPTDNLSGWLRQNTEHDGLLSKGVRDGGGREVPFTDVVAVHRANQLKSTRNIGTFFPGTDDMFRGILPYAVSGGALAAAMGRPTGASASTLPSGWVPPSAKAELEGMEPPAWLDPVELISSFASAGGNAAFRTGQTALDAAQGWLADKIPAIPVVPEEYYEAAQ